MADIYDRQKKLELNIDTSISVAGCGGVGFWVAKFAAMSGIPKIYLYDPDIIEIHNLNRLDIPEKFLGRNKADITGIILKSLRAECDVKAFGMKLQPFTFAETEWLVDCTDNFESQTINRQIAEDNNAKYMKVGYDGENISINDEIAEWGEAEDGYVVIPSWCVPASVVGALAVAKIVKYPSKELGTKISKLFNYG
jgi:tRNA A37 threonylcarbamoyladenosine dehydratase